VNREKSIQLYQGFQPKYAHKSDRIAIEPLKVQLQKARSLHQQDLALGYGSVNLPHALERKYPNANRQWNWQFVFPSWKRSVDPRTQVVRRHHIYEQSIQRAVKQAIQKAGVTKHGG
jgi:integrase